MTVPQSLAEEHYAEHTDINLPPTNLRPFLSMREIISPIKFLCTASGLIIKTNRGQHTQWKEHF
jgi:hypothetical protein